VLCDRRAHHPDPDRIEGKARRCPGVVKGLFHGAVLLRIGTAPAAPDRIVNPSKASVEPCAEELGRIGPARRMPDEQALDHSCDFGVQDHRAFYRR
jgi:hypothetical protein